MKKALSIFFTLVIMIILTGCGKDNKEEVLKKFSKKINDTKGYQLEADMKLINNEDSYNYDLLVSYKKDDNFRVSLKNKANNHEQVILKNSDGVYVITPSLNKSFKFQSKWPYNNSQSYILQSIVSDLTKDSKLKMKKIKDGYILKSKVNYKNNAKLIYQEIVLDNNYIIKKATVYSENNVPQIVVNFKNVDMNAKFKKNYFSTDENITMSSKFETTENQIKPLEDAIYPMYLPKGTYLDLEKTVDIDGGSRIIMTFKGDQSFMLVEEQAVKNDDSVIIPTSGDIDIVSDCIAIIDDSSISWTSNNIDYYLTSNDLSKAELLEVAKSISVMPITK